MPDYVEKSFCRGVVPAGVPAFNVERRALVTKLICEKDKARVICAPSGYGKTALCAFYAHSSFSFKRTFWFDCMSSCFVRDLNSKTLQKVIDRKGEEVKLCVFNELPHLSDEEQRNFLCFLRHLLDLKIEVLVNTAPEAKNDFLENENVYFMHPHDLLIEKNNIDSIPAISFGRGGERTIFESLQTHGLYRNEILLYYCALVLQKGTFKDFEKICDKRFLKRDLKFLSKSFPHLLIDFQEATFKSVNFNVEDIRAGFNFAISEVVKSSKQKNYEHFFRCLADCLIEKRHFERAKNFVIRNLTVAERLDWVLDNSQKFVDACEAHHAIECLDTSTQQMGPRRDEIHSCLCHLHFCIENFEKAKNLSCTILRSRKAEPNVKLYACLAALLCSDDASDFELCELLVELTEVHKQQVLMQIPFSSFKFTSEDILFIHDFIIVWYEDASNALVFLINEINERNKSQEKCSLDAICVCVSFVLRCLLHNAFAQKSLTALLPSIFAGFANLDLLHDLIGTLVKFSFDSLEEFDSCDQVSHEVFSSCDFALQVCEQLCSDYLEFTDINSIMYIKSRRREKESDLLVVRELEKSAETAICKRNSTAAGSLADFVKINFFGGASFEVDGRIVECDLTRRSNCLFFLFILSENLGREIPREALIDRIWHDNPSCDGNKRNFYNTLSTMRKCFDKLSSVSFFKSNRTGYFLDPSACATDVQEFDALCNILNFDARGVLENMKDIAEQVEHFERQLLPQVLRFQELEEKRMGYREKLVDALIFASVSLMECNNYRCALWFAREAKKLDKNREDIYYLIMKAQNGMNLRSSAVTTFFECKNILNEELGIMPSDEIKNLYQVVIS